MLTFLSQADVFKQRMAGLSALLQHPPSTPLTFNPDSALEQALLIPSSIGIDLDGLKAMMLYYEAYRLIGDWRAAPVGLVRTAGVVRPVHPCFESLWLTKFMMK